MKLEFDGKEEAKKQAREPATRKDIEFKDENLLIKGDNLEVLKNLQANYKEKIKMIYIDPPYNTGNKFIYLDKFKGHDGWLSFMYPRLMLARELLKEDGVIFISIDDNEVAQLKLIMNEIFGEENFVGQISILSNPRGRQSSKNITKSHEYLLTYQKTTSLKFNGEPLTEKNIKEYNKKDDYGVYRELGLRNRGNGCLKEESPTLFFPIYYDKAKGIQENNSEGAVEIIPKLKDGRMGSWRWSMKKILKDRNFLCVRKVKREAGLEFDVFQKDYLTDKTSRAVKTMWCEKELNYQNSTLELKAHFNKKLFDYAKPVYLIKRLLKLATGSDSVILDFFAGSGTTGEAVLKLNEEDGGNRKFILVQLPELIDKKKSKVAYEFCSEELGVEEPTIYNITRERLKRAGCEFKEILE